MSILDDAIAAGKCPKERRDFYRRQLARDPEATVRLIASLYAVPGLPSRAALSRGPIRTDAGRRVVPAALGGYVVEES